MTEQEIRELIAAGRAFTRCQMDDNDDYESDQDKKLPQPPLDRGAITANAIKLPRDFASLSLKGNYLDIINSRKSRRIYTDEPMTLTELSFLLWATQGVKEIRGKKYATLRTVPSGGARHAFETYLAVMNVAGLEPGAYHYLPMTHSIEYLGKIENITDTVTHSLSDQKFGSKAAAVFYYSFVPYRAEWRYGIYAHRIALVDLGHVGQALYMAAEAAGLGTCGIGAFDEEACNAMFSLDGKEEFTAYAEPVGRYKAEDVKKELAFYAFVEEEGL